MAFDHSQTYKKLSLRNIPHILRAYSIRKAVKKLSLSDSPSYFDIGCSNGYLTKQVASIIGAQNVTGWDHNRENIEKAKSLYPDISFLYINLNISSSISKQAQFITCFETIEHVGNIKEAINNIDRMAISDGQILYTVPIESGFIGAIKYFIKTRLFKYDLSEISTDKKDWKAYEKTLLKNGDIGLFRNEREGWGTHFGFDYRSFEQELKSKYSSLDAWTVGTSRFLLVTKT